MCSLVTAQLAREQLAREAKLRKQERFLASRRKSLAALKAASAADASLALTDPTFLDDAGPPGAAPVFRNSLSLLALSRVSHSPRT